MTTLKSCALEYTDLFQIIALPSVQQVHKEIRKPHCAIRDRDTNGDEPTVGYMSCPPISRHGVPRNSSPQFIYSTTLKRLTEGSPRSSSQELYISRDVRYTLQDLATDDVFATEFSTGVTGM